MCRDRAGARRAACLGRARGEGRRGGSSTGLPRAFLGLGDGFPTEQLVTRSVTGRAIFLMGGAVLRLLRADASAKLHLVNTGTKVLEKVEARPGHPFPFRLMQEGVHHLAPLMTRQRLFASTADLLELLKRRYMPAAALTSDALRAAVLAADDGCVAIVHDPQGTGTMPADGPLPLVLAATRTPGLAPTLELSIKGSEAASLYNRTAPTPLDDAAIGPPSVAAEGAAAAGAATTGDVGAEAVAGVVAEAVAGAVAGATEAEATAE